MKEQTQYRDPVTKQYAFDNNFDRICVCGHVLGVHIAGGFECGTMPSDPSSGCSCQKFKQKKITLADMVAVVMKERDQKLIWYGDPDLCHEAYERVHEGKNNKHPLNVISGVIQSCAKSKLFFKSGYIEHLGRHYPVYEIKSNDSKGDKP